ncbi:Aldo/keto reductase [Venturia nashicola]|nr:Aldo/keto reductase [Venturia nashicola]
MNPSLDFEWNLPNQKCRLRYTLHIVGNVKNLQLLRRPVRGEDKPSSPPLKIPTGRAGGLLASTPSSRYQEHNPGIANWIGMYKGKSKLDEGVDSVRRWAVHDSPLRKSDGIVLGARSKGQLVQNLERIKKGGLPDGVKEILDEIWDHVKIVAPGLV